MRKKQLIILGLIIISVISIPLTLFIFNKQQEIRSKAENSTMLTFSPTSSDTAQIQSHVGEILPLDIMINPGVNAVSVINLEILYDQTKLEATGTSPFEANLTAFPQVTNGPLYSPGKITVSVSIGPDLSKVIQQATRVGTIKFKALTSTNTNESPTLVTFGPNTQVLAVGTNTNANILSNTQPATIAIDLPPIPTCAPRPACLDTEPKCLIPEPTGGWCSQPTSIPTLIPVPTIAKCPNASTDSIVIIDKSGSMNDRISASLTTKIKSAKEAANRFVDILSIDASNKIGLVSFATQSTLNSPLTNNFAQIKNLINNINANGYTCHQCAINKANQEFTTNGRLNVKKVAILLTDGKANWIEGGIQKASQTTAEQKAMDAINNTSVPNHIVFYTIGLGNDVNSAFLKQIADKTGGKYFFSPTVDDLQGIYQEISLVLAKGSINGFVFNDANNNGTFDQNESKLSEWSVYAQNSGTATPQPTPQPIKTDESGTYNIGNLCDGSYTLKQTAQPGWTQTVPVNPNEYMVNITGGSAVTDKNFGNYKNEPTPIPPTPTLLPPTPTSTIEPTPTPAGTTLILNGLLDGIGSRGDNSNPDGSSSNKNPLTTERNIKVSLFNTSNLLIASAEGTMKYSSQSGSFIASIILAQQIPTGNYTIKTSTDFHLTRLLPGIQNIISDQENKLQNSIFIAGDITNDNKLDIRDYNALIDCYSDLEPPTACSDAQKKKSSDLNDDASVNQFDYNLFLREIATQPGQ